MNAHLVDRDYAVSGYAEFERVTEVLVYLVEVDPQELPAPGDDEELGDFDLAILDSIKESADAPPFNRYDVEIGAVADMSVTCEVYPI